jgi:hypothetical protein
VGERGRGGSAVRSRRAPLPRPLAQLLVRHLAVWELDTVAAWRSLPQSDARKLVISASQDAIIPTCVPGGGGRGRGFGWRMRTGACAQGANGATLDPPRRPAQLETQLAVAGVPRERWGETLAMEEAAGDAHNRAFTHREAATFLRLLDYMVAGHTLGGGAGSGEGSDAGVQRHGLGGVGAPVHPPAPGSGGGGRAGAEAAPEGEQRRSAVAEAARRRLAARSAALAAGGGGGDGGGGDGGGGDGGM